MIDQLITNRSQDSFYNYTDLNRISLAMNYIAQLITKEGYFTFINMPSSWQMGDIYYKEDGQELIENLNLIKTNFASKNLSPLPASLLFLDYQGANKIEQFLLDVANLLNETIIIYPECGDLETEA